MALPVTLDPNGPPDDTIGALYIGVLISAIVYGLCLLQAFFYFQKYKHDAWYIKAAVITVITFDTVHLALTSIGVYHYTIRTIQDRRLLQRLYWPLSIEAVFVGLNGGIVQIFYTYRVWRLSRHNWILCGLIVLFILAEIGSGMTWVIMSARMKTFYDLLRLTNVTIVIDCASCAADILIAGSLCVLLHRSRTGFRRTDTLINKLILFVINTGMLTTVVSISALIALVASPLGLIYGVFYFSLGHLYTNSLLATLNARVATCTGFHLDETELKPTSTAQASMASRMKNISIRIETIHEAVSDAEKIIGESSRDDNENYTETTGKGHRF